MEFASSDDAKVARERLRRIAHTAAVGDKEASLARRDTIERFITEETQTRSTALLRVLETGSTEIGADEKIDILLRGVKALYLAQLWLADELDKIEARPGH